MSRSERWSPLFPLGLVLLPKEQLPLHIFEPRYRAMTERCEAEAIPFCVVLAKPEGLVGIGCEAWIEETLRTYPDGRRDIMTIGGDRLKLVSVREHRVGYLEGLVELFEDLEAPPEAGGASDDAPIDPEASATLLSLHRQCQHLQAAMVRSLGEPDRAWSEEPEIEVEPGYTFALAARTQMGPVERQSLLEIRRESEREEYLLGFLARLRPRLEQALKDLPRVQSNGKAEPRE